MKKFLPLLLLFPVTVLAQSPFDGTWVVNLKKAQLPRKPDVYSLQDGVYECSTCVPRIKVEADGKDHPIAGSPYFSTVSVRVMDNNDVEITEKRAKKLVYTETDKVASDGGTLRQDVTDLAGPSGEAVVAQETYRRVSPGPAGANAVSGSWQAQKVKIISENGSTVAYRSTPHGLQASNRSGEGYDAKFDGKQYPVHGDPTHSTVSLRRINSHVIEETDWQDGVVHYKVRMSVSADGKTMKVTERDLERGTKMTYFLEKKSS